MRRLLAAQITKLLPVQVVYFHESNASGVVHTTYNRGLVARLQLRNDRRLGWVSWSMPARLNSGDLAGCDDATDYRMLPVIVRGNQSSCAIVQFQGGVSQCIGNIIWRRTELSAYGANNHSLGARSLNDEATNHDVVTGLHKTARADIAKN